MACFNDYIFIGCFNSCSEIELGFQALQAGVHTITVNQTNGSFYYLTASLNIGDNFTIDLSKLNESDTITINIMQPDLTMYDFGGSENIRFKTFIANGV